MTCETCGKKHDGKYGSGRFCCAKCARAFSSKHVSEEGRKKQKEILSDKSNLLKSFNSRMSKNENYEQDSDGTWKRKMPVSKQYGYKSKTKHKHTLTLGKIGELKTAEKFLKHGYNVFVPLVDISGVDMIVEKNDGLKKVQVKSSSMTTNDNSCTSFNLRSSDFDMKNGQVISYNKTYSKKDVDFFALYSTNDDDVYLIENDEKRKSVFIRNKLSENNLTTKGKNLEKIHMAEDYQIDNVLDKIDREVDRDNIIIVDNFIDTTSK